jgi:hypothetical protein
MDVVIALYPIEPEPKLMRNEIPIELPNTPDMTSSSSKKNAKNSTEEIFDQVPLRSA